MIALFLPSHPLDEDHGGDDGQANGVRLQAGHDHQQAAGCEKNPDERIYMLEKMTVERGTDAKKPKHGGDDDEQRLHENGPSVARHVL